MAIKPYHYEPLTDFSVPENRKAMEEALREVRSQFGLSYPLVIGADRIDTEKKIVSVNPSNPQQVIGSVSKADTSHIDMALETGWKAFAQWKKVPGPMRARYLYKAAAIMRRRKLFLSALEVYEAGKTWTEAEADVAEAIDFLEYYGRQMERLSEPVPLIPLDDEEDRAFYVPLGVGAIIPPWNFPLAILTGMTSAAIVTGNCVILKPASATPIIGAHFAEIMREAGLPSGVLNFVPGDGGTIGDYIVTHPLTRFISFTGSREVGLRINQLAAQVSPGQKWIKRVVAEMGGKDAIVVDETADLDAAAEGIVTSAFGFQGQKCSACSRAIIVDDVYDLLLSKIVERTKKLRVGPADNLNNHMGPVIDEKAYEKIFGYIQWGKENAKLQTGGTTLDGEGYFIPPTIFSDVAPGSKLEQEEVFGPVLAVIRAKDWSDALKIANDTEYGLTGSVYTARRERIEQAADEFEVGNLYINRKCTGAIVGAHPFGGFNMSGTDSKTGSPDYLLLFMQMKVVAERF
ncbi:delta-1-pyrroline-5-carboxylate dehydrogenase [Sulfobacillus thermosulfidooxidans DSM 9293]|uniref:L-glutamate gamma-semialdehyde dehydrogenase n=1 Tax=Sulfobacillus thermosulfidooxidans (strain DSM 9293 / VKM B-1269 / AT-1) TaxID=929705 RepID=A0A1W1WAP8_SULTA|nr:L-glutamate gamma-semialdehyde dehydrogenase [Sulfobacillus thermosulfidooxidans]SMC03371.1 delta-1-pyrroline-5-carboxylate dehydrogenase [Sulfobacillus thermosulfidooxidans DSM 9293]